MNAMSKQQQGFSFTGFIVAACLLIAVAILGMKLVPPYMENGKIKKSFDAIVHDPAMLNAPDKDIRMSFFNRAITMDSVTAISDQDFEISRDNGGLALSANYSVKVPVAGNVSLLIEFHPTSGN